MLYEVITHFPGSKATTDSVSQGDDIPIFMGHLLAVDQHHLRMEPIFCQRLIGQRLGNCDLILMVGKDEISAGCVDIHGLAEIANT